MINKQKYKDFCKLENDLPIFSQHWWLDAVCGKDNWDVVIIEKGGQIWATMPYYTTRKMMLKMVFMPKITQFMGPYIKYPKGQKYERKLSYEKEIMTELIDKLPKVDFFYQDFSPSIQNWLPFFWNGFKQTTRYTYSIEDTSDIDNIFSDFKSNIKTDIKKAKKIVNIDTSLGIENFYNINKMTFDRQNMDIPYSLDFLRNFDKKCKENNASKIYFAIDKENNIHSAIYVVWDKQTMYYLLSGGNPQFRNSGATSLLLFEAIQDASKMGLSFDFEGSMIEPIEKVFRAFGGKLTPYYQVTKAKNRFIHSLFCITKG